MCSMRFKVRPRLGTVAGQESAGWCIQQVLEPRDQRCHPGDVNTGPSTTMLRSQGATRHTEEQANPTEEAGGAQEATHSRAWRRRRTGFAVK